MFWSAGYFWPWIQDPGWKNSDPRSGINILDPQHWYFSWPFFLSLSLYSMWKPCVNYNYDIIACCCHTHLTRSPLLYISACFFISLIDAIIKFLVVSLCSPHTVTLFINIKFVFFLNRSTVLFKTSIGLLFFLSDNKYPCFLLDIWMFRPIFSQ